MPGYYECQLFVRPDLDHGRDSDQQRLRVLPRATALVAVGVLIHLTDTVRRAFRDPVRVAQTCILVIVPVNRKITDWLDYAGAVLM